MLISNHHLHALLLHYAVLCIKFQMPLDVRCEDKCSSPRLYHGVCNAALICCCTMRPKQDCIVLVGHITGCKTSVVVSGDNNLLHENPTAGGLRCYRCSIAQQCPLLAVIQRRHANMLRQRGTNAGQTRDIVRALLGPTCSVHACAGCRCRGY